MKKSYVRAGRTHIIGRTHQIYGDQPPLLAVEDPSSWSHSLKKKIVQVARRIIGRTHQTIGRTTHLLRSKINWSHDEIMGEAHQTGRKDVKKKIYRSHNISIDNKKLNFN